MSELSERAAFEAFWSGNMNLQEMDLHRFGDDYACHETNRAWMTWQAACAAPAQELSALPELTDAEIDTLMARGLPNTRPSEGFRKFARDVESRVRGRAMAQGKSGISWPDGYCTDPNGVIIAPAGKHEDFSFGYNIGYADGLVAIKDSVKAIEARVRGQQGGSDAALDALAAQFSQPYMEYFGSDIQDAIKAIKAKG